MIKQEEIEILAKEKGISIKDLAQYCNIPYTTLHSALKRGSKISYNNMCRIEEVLNNWPESRNIEYVYKHKMRSTEYIEYVLNVNKIEIRDRVINFLASEYKDYKFSDEEWNMPLSEFIAERRDDLSDNMYDFLFGLVNKYITNGLLLHIKEAFGDSSITEHLVEEIRKDCCYDDFPYSTTYDLVYMYKEGLDFLQIPDLTVNQFYKNNCLIPPYRKDEALSLLDLYDQYINKPGRVRENTIYYVIQADTMMIKFALDNNATFDKLVDKYGREASKVIYMIKNKMGAIKQEWGEEPQLLKIAEAYNNKTTEDTWIS